MSSLPPVEQLNPADTVAYLISLTPGFQSRWEDHDNYFRNEDGSFTHHGVFSEYSSFIKHNWHSLDDQTWQQLGVFLEACVSSKIDIGDAACTCFLENLAGEGAVSKKLRGFLGDRSRKYFDDWDGRG